MLKVAASVAFVVATVVYPLAVYLGLSRWGVAQVSYLVGAAALFTLAMRWLVFAKRFDWDLLRPALIVFACAGLGWWINDQRFLLFLPVLINAGLLFSFGKTLYEEVPLVERFARLAHSDLSAEEVQYCRQVTKLWCVFFVGNGFVAGLLAGFAPLSWWATYTGLLAYLLMGALMVGEYLLRKKRFGRFGSGFPDRWLAPVFSASRGKP